MTADRAEELAQEAMRKLGEVDCSKNKFAAALVAPGIIFDVIRQARDEALEEAAKACSEATTEDVGDDWYNESYAGVVRALKSKPEAK